MLNDKSSSIELSARKHHTAPTYNVLYQDRSENSSFDLEIEEDIDGESKYDKSILGGLPISNMNRGLFNQSTINYSTLPMTERQGGTLETSSVASVQAASHRSPIFTAFVNLISTIIGAGILGIPYALSRTGWIIGTFCLFLCAFLSYSGLHLLSECVKKVHAPSCTFYTVAELALPNYSKLIDFAIMLKGIGVATSYLIVVTDSLPKAFRPFLTLTTNELLFENRIYCILISYIIILPLSYLPYLESLKYTSLISLVMILFLVSLIFFYSFHFPFLNPCESIIHNNTNIQQHFRSFLRSSSSSSSLSSSSSSSISSGLEVMKDHRRILLEAAAVVIKQCSGKRYFFPYFLSSAETYPVQYHGYDLFRLFPIFLFSFTCHQNTFNVINELERPTTKRVDQVFTISILITLVLYLIISYSAYLTFGDYIGSDILTSYPENTISSVCRLFMSLVVISHYPLQLFASRKCALTLWQSFSPGVDYPWRFIIFTVFFNILTFVIAAVVEDLGFVFSMLGTITSSLVILLLPSAFYLKLFPDGPHWKRTGSKIMFVLGWAIMTISLIFNIINASAGGTSH